MKWPNRIRILILPANPKGTLLLGLNEEVRLIEKILLQSLGRDRFIIKVLPAFTISDLLRELVEFKPTIVHFCGHGTGTNGIICDDETGEMRSIPTIALANLFKTVSKYVKCVVLNACYSEIQAAEIVRHIDYVVGMRSAIGDSAAINFAIGFYTALFAGEDIPTCYKLGVSAIELKNIAEHLTPILKIRQPRPAQKKASVRRRTPRNFEKSKLTPVAYLIDLLRPGSRRSRTSSVRPPPLVNGPSPQMYPGRRSFFKLSGTALVALATGWKLGAMAASRDPLTGAFKQLVFQDELKLKDTRYFVKSYSCTLSVTHAENGYYFTEMTYVRLRFESENKQIIGGYVNTWEWEELRQINSTKIETKAAKVERGIFEIDFASFAKPEYAEEFVEAQRWLEERYQASTAKATWSLEDGALKKTVDYGKGPKRETDVFYRI